MTTEVPAALQQAILHEAMTGLTAKPQKTLSPWLFYDERGSQLFEQITTLPEYYLTRTERSILNTRADDIFLEFVTNVTIAELGAGTASKTGILLHAATRFQPEVLYQPIDISPSALTEAANSLISIPGVIVQPRVANYITEPYTLERPEGCRILALYIGSSIGNFSPAEAASILRNLRSRLLPGDALLLGVDLAPSENKSVDDLLLAYNDAAGITAAFNKNILARLNRDLETDFNLDAFAHRARWNADASRIEMHLESLTAQTVHLPNNGKIERIRFAAGETIHTENSYKFTNAALANLLDTAGFTTARFFYDPGHIFAVTLARAV